MKSLKDAVGEELFNTLKLGDMQVLVFEKDQKVLVDDGSLIPKYRLDEVITKNKSLSELVEKNDKDLKELQKMAVGNKELTDQIDNLKKESKDAKEKSEKVELENKKHFALLESLLDAGVQDPEARKTLALKIKTDLGSDKIELDEKGSVKGFEEILKPVKENKAFSGFFGEIKAKGNQHKEGELPDEWINKNPFSRKTLNIAEQIRLKREKPDLAKTLESASN